MTPISDQEPARADKWFLLGAGIVVCLLPLLAHPSYLSALRAVLFFASLGLPATYIMTRSKLRYPARMALFWVYFVLWFFVILRLIAYLTQSW